MDCLRRAGATIEREDSAAAAAPITKQDLMSLGLSGGKDSSVKRGMLLQKLELPAHMSSNAMLQALNLLYSLEELTAIMEEI